MATETKMNEKKLRLLNLLREMFQLDRPDLDFGLYRIMHAKRAQVEAFLETEFDQLIDKVFASRGARQEDEARKEYEATRQQAVEFGAPDPEAVPKVQQARARYEVVRLTGGEDAEIYDHLHRFFSRYYDEGDFMSLRRYGKGAAGGAEAYAVPYDGTEVVLHWANKDQYYIKTTENFSHFSFDPRKVLQKDERGVNGKEYDFKLDAPLPILKLPLPAKLMVRRVELDWYHWLHTGQHTTASGHRTRCAAGRFDLPARECSVRALSRWQGA